MEPLCTLDDWLAHVEKLHEKPIDLGLDRMKLMIERMGIRFECPVVTVAGTNGKGSTCAMIERICRAAGLRTGMHTSPHLIRFNERALLCGREASDEALVECLKEVEDALRSMPEVADALAFGQKNSVLGNILCADIKLKEGAQADVARIRNFLADKLQPFKIPRKIRFVVSMESTATGKIKRL